MQTSIFTPRRREHITIRTYQMYDERTGQIRGYGALAYWPTRYYEQTYACYATPAAAIRSMRNQIKRRY
jgi:hypothetical protein